MCKFIEKCSTLLRDCRQKTFKFLSRLCLLRGGGGGQAKSAKNCQFPDKSLISNWTHHTTVITKQQNESTRLPFNLLNSCPYANFYAGEHAHWPKTHQPKTQKSACWKPVLNIREQNSSHLQDYSNAFSTKDRVKWLSQSQRVFAA